MKGGIIGQNLVNCFIKKASYSSYQIDIGQCYNMFRQMVYILCPVFRGRLSFIAGWYCIVGFSFVGCLLMVRFCLFSEVSWSGESYLKLFNILPKGLETMNYFIALNFFVVSLHVLCFDFSLKNFTDKQWLIELWNKQTLER